MCSTCCCSQSKPDTLVPSLSSDANCPLVTGMYARTCESLLEFIVLGSDHAQMSHKLSVDSTTMAGLFVITDSTVIAIVLWNPTHSFEQNVGSLYSVTWHDFTTVSFSV